jgi:hypothetical protein
MRADLKICFLGARSVYLHLLAVCLFICFGVRHTVKGMARQTSYGVFKKQKKLFINMPYEKIIIKKKGLEINCIGSLFVSR